MVKNLHEIFHFYRTHPEFLISGVSDVNQVGDITEDRLIHIVAHKGNIEELKTLIDNKADINVAGAIGNTPLHCAAMKGHLELVKILIGYGADLKIENRFGQSPYDVAVLGNHSHLLSLLKAKNERSSLNR